MKIHMLMVPVIGVMLSGCPTPVTINATFSFVNGGKSIPAAKAKVNVLVGGSLMANTSTDMSGKASFTFVPFASPITYQLSMQNAAVSYSDNGCGQPPAPFEGTLSPPTKAPVQSYDIAIPMKPLTLAEAWIYLNQVANVANALPGFTMFPISTCSGTSNHFSKKTKTIELNLSPSAPFLEDKVYHEYGHAVMYEAVGGPYDNTACQTHQMGIDVGPTCAWVEGWADFFAVFVRMTLDPTLSPTFQSNNIEGYMSSIDGSDGYKDEGRVAAGLWDLYDANDDSNNSHDPRYGYPFGGDANRSYQVTVSQMLASMRFLNTASIRTFYQKLRPTLSTEVQTRADDIMRYNWLSRVPTGEAARSSSRHRSR